MGHGGGWFPVRAGTRGRAERDEPEERGFLGLIDSAELHPAAQFLGDQLPHHDELADVFEAVADRPS